MGIKSFYFSTLLLITPILSVAQPLNEQLDTLRYEILENLRIRGEQLLSKASIFQEEKDIKDEATVRQKLIRWKESDVIELQDIDTTLDQAYRSAARKGMNIELLRDSYQLARRSVLELELLPDIDPKNISESPDDSEDDPTDQITHYRLSLYKEIHLTFVLAILANTDFQTVSHLEQLKLAIQKISTSEARIAEKKIQELLDIQKGVLEVFQLLGLISEISTKLSYNNKLFTNSQEELLIQLVDKAFQLPVDAFIQHWKRRPSLREGFLKTASYVRHFSIPLSETTNKTVEELLAFANRLTPAKSEYIFTKAIAESEIKEVIRKTITQSKGSIRTAAWIRADKIAKATKSAMAKFQNTELNKRLSNKKYLNNVSICATDILCRKEVTLKPKLLKSIIELDQHLFGKSNQGSIAKSGAVDILAYEALYKLLEERLAADEENPIDTLSPIVAQLKNLLHANNPIPLQTLVKEKRVQIQKVSYTPKEDAWPLHTFFYQLRAFKRTLILPADVVKRAFGNALFKALKMGVSPKTPEALPAKLGHQIIGMETLEAGSINQHEIHANWNFNEARQLTEMIRANNFQESENLVLEAELRLGTAMLEVAHGVEAFLKSTGVENITQSSFFSNRVKTALRLFSRIGIPETTNPLNPPKKLTPADIDSILQALGTTPEQVSKDFFSTSKVIEALESLTIIQRATSR